MLFEVTGLGFLFSVLRLELLLDLLLGRELQPLLVQLGFLALKLLHSGFQELIRLSHFLVPVVELLDLLIELALLVSEDFGLANLAVLQEELQLLVIAEGTFHLRGETTQFLLERGVLGLEALDLVV